MAFLHDPKKLTETVELDYFRRPRWFRRGKWSISFLVFLASLAAVGFTLLPGQRHVYEASPVSVGHAMFNNDCGACHTRAFQTLERFVRADPSHHSVSEQTCQKCHAAGGHHGSMPGCVACHREHRGRAVLAEVPDRQCTVCHASLKEKKPGTDFESTSTFSTHPEFALWRRKQPDPGTVQFNHVKHLALPSQTGLPGLDRATALLKERQCAYCHQPDPAGRYMKPIKYEAHCQSCHPLRAAVAGNWSAATIRGAASAFARQPLPHPAPGQGPALARAVLRQRYLDFAQQHPVVLKSGSSPEVAVAPRPLPGRRGQPASPAQLSFVEQQMQTAERLLFDGGDGCRRCHQEISSPLGRSNGLPDYGKPAIPERWFSHSKFKHHSHRMQDCLECHPQALASKSPRDLLMPRIDMCQRCHGGAGGARADCFECHDFHARK